MSATKTYREARDYAERLNRALDAYDFSAPYWVRIIEEDSSTHFLANAFVLNWFDWHIVIREHGYPIIVSANDGEAIAVMIEPIHAHEAYTLSAIESRRETFANQPSKRKHEIPYE